MSWIGFSLLATITWSISNIGDKVVLTRWVKNPLVPLTVVNGVGFVLALVILLAKGLPTVPPSLVGWVLFTSVFAVLSSFCYYKAAQRQEISRVVPLFYLAPVLVTLLAAVFLSERFPFFTYVGIALLILGAIIISSSQLFPLRLGAAFWWMMGAMVSIAAYDVLIKYLLGYADFWTVFAWMRFGAMLICLPIFYTTLPAFSSLVKNHGWKIVAGISLNEFMGMLGVLAHVIATGLGPATLVNAFVSVHPLVLLVCTLLLGSMFPNVLVEERGRAVVSKKFFAIALMVSGAILIAR